MHLQVVDPRCDLLEPGKVVDGRQIDVHVFERTGARGLGKRQGYGKVRSGLRNRDRWQAAENLLNLGDEFGGFEWHRGRQLARIFDRARPRRRNRICRRSSNPPR